MIWALLFACEAELKCPTGFSENHDLSERVLALIDHQEKPKICWGKRILSVIDEKNRLLMDRSLSEKAAAARAAHLIHHTGKNFPPGPDCLNSWIQEEAESMALELDLLRKWGEETGQYAHSEIYFSAPPGKGLSMLKGFIRSNPEGARGMDALIKGYKNKCGMKPEKKR